MARESHYKEFTTMNQEDTFLDHLDEWIRDVNKLKSDAQVEVRLAQSKLLTQVEVLRALQESRAAYLRSQDHAKKEVAR